VSDLLRRGLVGAGSTALALGVLQRRRTVRTVPRELRTRSLWLPLAIGDRRSLALARRWFVGPSEPVPGVVVEEHQVPGGERVFLHDPDGRTRPSGALLWIHGGGMILGAPEGSHERCSRLARDLGIVVVSAGYRLAPEHPFPAALDDLVAALRWLHERSPELGVDRGRTAVGGTSAGAGLAAALTQRVLDEGGPELCFQLLVEPMLDDRTVLRRDLAGRGALAWTPRSNRFAWRSYLGHRVGEGEPPPYAVPARRRDLRGLPPAWIGVGDLDLFHDEDVEYARRLRAAGTAVDLQVVPGMYHGAAGELDPPPPVVRDFTRSMTEALRAAIGPRAART
jgi:acetyl esterase/lipase